MRRTNATGVHVQSGIHEEVNTTDRVFEQHVEVVFPRTEIRRAEG